MKSHKTQNTYKERELKIHKLKSKPIDVNSDTEATDSSSGGKTKDFSDLCIQVIYYIHHI